MPEIGDEDGDPAERGVAEEGDRLCEKPPLDERSVQQSAGGGEDQLPGDADHDRRRDQRQEQKAHQNAVLFQEVAEEQRDRKPKGKLDAGREKCIDDGLCHRGQELRVVEGKREILQPRESLEGLAKRAFAECQGDQKDQWIKRRDEERNRDGSDPEVAQETGVARLIAFNIRAGNACGGKDIRNRHRSLLF